MTWLLTISLCTAGICHTERREIAGRGPCIQAELAVKRQGGWAHCHMVKLPMAEAE